MDFVFGLLMLTFCLVIHEAAHAVVGYRRGYRIEAVGIGFGPSLVIGVRAFGQTWPHLKFGLLPIGAYVKFADERVEDDWPSILAGPAGSLVGAIMLGLLALPFASTERDRVIDLIGPLAGFIITLPAVLPFFLIHLGPGIFSGPIGATAELASAAQSGLHDWLQMGALVSAGIGALNLWPLPPLDGGKAVLVWLRSRYGKRGRAIGEAWTITGAVVLLAFVLAISVHDVWSLLAR